MRTALPHFAAIGCLAAGAAFAQEDLREEALSTFAPLEGDKGRFAVTETVADEYVFRAAPLRNIAVTAPYFHSGMVWDLGTAVEIMAESQLGAELAVEEADAIVAFLESLTGALPEVVYPLLPAESADTPRPSGVVIK